MKVKKFATVVMAATLVFSNVPATLAYAEEAGNTAYATTAAETVVEDFNQLKAALNANATNIEIKENSHVIATEPVVIPSGTTITVMSGASLENENQMIINGSIINKGTVIMFKNCSYQVNGTLTNENGSTVRVYEDLLFDGTGKMVSKAGSVALVETTNFLTVPYICSNENGFFKLESGTITFTKETGNRVNINLDPSSAVRVYNPKDNEALIWRDQIVHVSPNATLTIEKDAVLTVMDAEPGRESGMIFNEGTINGAGTVKNNGKIRNLGSLSVNVTGNKPYRDYVDAAVVTGLSNMAYTGQAVTLSPTVSLNGVTLAEGRDYTLSYENNVNPGTATMIITGAGEYIGSKSVTFRVLTAAEAKDIANAIVEGIEDKDYTGKALKQKFTVSLDGKILKEKKEYSVSYKKNKTAGTATVTIKGKGKLKGKQQLKFQIAKAENPLMAKAKTPNASLKEKNLVKKGKSISLSKVVKITKKGQGKLSYAKESGDPRITVNKKNGKVTLQKGTPVGSYTATVIVTAAGNKNYKGIGVPVTFTVKVV